MLVSPEQDPRPHRAEVTGVPPFHTPKGSSSYSEDHHHHTGLAIALWRGGGGGCLGEPRSFLGLVF